MRSYCAVPAVLALAILAACDTDTTGPEAAVPGSANVARIWSEAVLAAIRETKNPPPMTGRTVAIVHTAMYDAWAAFDDVAIGTRLGGALRRPPDERTTTRKEEAVSFAAYHALVDLFPGRVVVLDSIMRDLGYDPSDVTTDATRPAGIGNIAAAAVLFAAHSDGANQLGGYADYTGYQPVNPPLDPTQPGTAGLLDPARWQPLIHGDGAVQKWTAPHWQKVTPFALASPDQFLPPPPAAPGSDEWRRQVSELIEISAGLTDQHKVIAEYWADGPSSEFPPGHWCLIADYVAVRDNHDLDRSVKMFFVVANAVFDAGIASWTAKIRYDYVRPITAIRYEMRGSEITAWRGPGLGTGPIPGDRWLPYQVASFRTPPFAEYISGHSTFSAAAATVLRHFTGSDDYGECASFPAGWSRVEPGMAPAAPVTLCWPTFTAAAAEAGRSRLYGGIHFRQANEEGLAIGSRVGDAVWARASAYFRGEAPAR